MNRLTHITHPLRTRTLLSVVALAAVASLVWTTASPAGSYQPPLQVVQVAKTVNVPGDVESVRGTVSCPDGYIATGGGTRVRETQPVMIEQDAPLRGGQGWSAQGGSMEDEEGETYHFTVTAICAKGRFAPALAPGR